jgi:hypothetical protein
MAAVYSPVRRGRLERVKDEPIISAGAIKAALAVLLVAALGVGTWALLDGRLGDIELPELPEIETTTERTR